MQTFTAFKKKLQNFDQISRVNVVFDTDNGCHLTLATRQ